MNRRKYVFCTFLLLFALAPVYVTYGQSAFVKERVNESVKRYETIMQMSAQSEEEPYLLNKMIFTYWGSSTEGEALPISCTIYFSFDWKPEFLDEDSDALDLSDECCFDYVPSLIVREWVKNGVQVRCEYLFDENDTTLMRTHRAETQVSTKQLLREVYNYFEDNHLLWGEDKHYDPRTGQVTSVVRSSSFENDKTGALSDMRMAESFCPLLQEAGCAL